MNYNWLKYEDIERSKYPNLLAEIKESGYSISTISECMGHSRHVQEDDPDTWNKLLGRDELPLEECVGLAHLFNVSYEYLVAHELTKAGEVSIAHLRWYKDIQKRKAECSLYMTQQDLYIYLIPEIAAIAVKCQHKDDSQYKEWKEKILAETPDDVKEFMEKVMYVIDDVRKRGKANETDK